MLKCNFSWDFPKKRTLCRTNCRSEEKGNSICNNWQKFALAADGKLSRSLRNPLFRIFPHSPFSFWKSVLELQMCNISGCLYVVYFWDTENCWPHWWLTWGLRGAVELSLALIKFHARPHGKGFRQLTRGSGSGRTICFRFRDLPDLLPFPKITRCTLICIFLGWDVQLNPQLDTLIGNFNLRKYEICLLHDKTKII